VRTAAEADALAQSLLARTSGSEVVLRGEATGDPRLGAGATVRLEGVGTKLTGGYRLTSVEHYYASGSPYVTRFVSGSKDPIGLADLVVGDASAGSRGGAGSAPSAPSGFVIGEVTNVDDPDRLARVRVKFPTLSADDESNWARVVSVGAGKQRGVQWLPEVGDEVLVGFEFDDVHRPVVMGGLWSRTDQPPESSAVSNGAVAQRVVATRKNHRIELVDDSTSRITLKLGDAGCEVTLTKDETKVVGEKKVVVHGDEVEVSADKKLVLRGQQVQITAQSDVTVSGQQIKLN
jgi:phage baseplate assembly protein gpV